MNNNAEVKNKEQSAQPTVSGKIEHVVSDASASSKSDISAELALIYLAREYRVELKYETWREVADAIIKAQTDRAN